MPVGRFHPFLRQRSEPRGVFERLLSGAAEPRRGGAPDGPDVDRLMDAIATVESLGSGGYSAVGPRDRRGDRPYGRYQVMGANLPEWSKRYLGRPYAPDEFLADTAAQDRLVRERLAELAEKHPIEDVASIWHSGQPLARARGRRDVLGTGTPDYVQKVTAAYQGTSGEDDSNRKGVFERLLADPASRSTTVAGTPEPVSRVATVQGTPESPGTPPARHPLARLGGAVTDVARGIPRGVGRMVGSAGQTLEMASVARREIEEAVLPRALEERLAPRDLERRVARGITEAGTGFAERPEFQVGADASPVTRFLSEAAETVPQLGAAVAGGAVAGPVGFMGPIFALEGGNAYQEHLARLSRTMPAEAAERQAAIVGTIVGAGNTLLEASLGVGVSNVLQKVPGARELFQREIMKRVPARMLTTGAAEGFEEVVQGAWNATAQFVGSKDPEVWEEFIQNVPREAALGATVGAGFGAANVGLGRDQGQQLLAPAEVEARLQQAAEIPIEPEIGLEIAPQGPEVQPVSTGVEPQRTEEVPPAAAVPPDVPIEPEAPQGVEPAPVQPDVPVAGTIPPAPPLAEREFAAAGTPKEIDAILQAKLAGNPEDSEALYRAAADRAMEIESPTTGPGPLVDDISARRAGMPDDLKADINLLAEENDFYHAVLTEGARVRLPDGFEGVVVRPLSSPREVDRNGMVLVEAPYRDPKTGEVISGGSRFYPALKINPLDRAPREFSRWLRGGWEGPRPDVAPEAAAQAPPPPPAEPARSLTLGSETTIIDADGGEVPARYGLVALEETVTSHDPETFAPNPAFPQVFQGRTLEKDKAAQAELVKQSEKPNAALLLDSTTRPTDGPEIMTPGGLLIAGRGRSIIKRRAQKRGKLGEYVERVKAEAERFGIDPAAVDAMIAQGQTPSIVRVLSDDATDPAVLDDLSRRFDLPPTKRMDALGEAAQRVRHLERAPAALEHLGRTMTEGTTVRQYLETPDGRAFLKTLVDDGIISGREMGAFVDPATGVATAEGKSFVEGLLQMAAVGDPRTVARAPDGILQKIQYATPAIVSTSRFEGWDLRPTLREALDLLAAVRAGGHKSVDDFISQQDMFGREFGAGAVDLARFLDENTQKAVSAGLRGYAQDAASANRAADSDDLFGYTPPTAAEARARRITREEVAFDPMGPDVTQESSFETHFGSDEFLDIEDLPAGVRGERPIDPLDPAAPIATARLRGTLAAPPKGAVRPVSAPEVIKSFAEIVKAGGRDVPVRTGRLGTKRARGVFKVRPEVIRINEANNIPTAAHEIAHALEKAVFGWPKGGPWKKPRADRAMQKELVALGKALYGSTKPAGGYKREGFAEFVRLWLTTDADAKTKAPTFHGWFQGEFLAQNDAIRKAFVEGKARAKRWREQGSLERARQSMVDTGTIPDRLRKAYKEVRRALSFDGMIDMAQPLYELAREAEARLGRTLTPSEDPFFTTSALRTTHSARVRYMIERGMIDLAGNPVGPALEELRPLVEGRQRDFTIFLWAKRAEALWLDPNRPGGRNPGLSLEDAQQIIADLTSVEFDLAASKVYEWNDGILNYSAQASPTFREIVKKVRAVDPGFYIPLQREFEELDNLWARSAKGPAGRSSPVKRLQGSGRRIKDPFQAMIANAESTIRAAHQRLVIEQIVKLARVEGMGKLIERVPHDQVPVAQATIEEILERVHTLSGLGPGEDVKLVGPFDTPLPHLLGETLTFFAPAQFPKGQDPIVPVYEEGSVNWYYVDEGLYGTLASMDVYRLPAILDWTLGSMAGAFRAGTTALRPAFGLITNPTRDLQTMYVNSQARSRGPALFAAWVKALASAFAVRTTGKGSTAHMDAFLRLGGEMAQSLGQDIPHTRRAAQRLFADRKARVMNPRNWYDWFRDVVQVPESAPRVAELERVAKDIGWAPGQPMTLDQSFQLLLAAKQVSTDFTAAGSFARAMNRMVPFFNAAVQGPRATVRAARRNPARVMARGLALSVLTAWLWWEQKDEEWYQALDFRERFLYWHFPVDIGGTEELVRLPRAFEIGMVFSALPQMLLDTWYTNDPEGVREYFTTLYKTSTPGFLPVPFEEAAEQLANRDFFFDRPIVPRGELDMPAEEQFNEYTSRAAIALGELFNVSPRRLDHAIRGVFGSVGGDVVELVGLGPDGGEREEEPADWPVIGRVFGRGGVEGVRSRQVDKLYDLAGDAIERQRSRKVEETENQRQARLQLADATDAVSALSYVRRFAKTRAQRVALTREINAVAEQAVADAKAGRLNRGAYSGTRRSAETREKAQKEGATAPAAPTGRRTVQRRSVERRAVERR